MSLPAFPDVQILDRELSVFEQGAQNQQLAVAVHSGIARIESLASGVVRMPGGHQASAHAHRHSEITVFVQRGLAASLVGDDMQPVLHAPGGVCYIAPGIPHAALNLQPRSADPRDADTRTVVAFEARTDPTFNDDVVLLPELDSLVAERAVRLRQMYRDGELDTQILAPHVHVVTR